jgi:predicted house-cleaning noncanonical NTP pyrophosphatase (MazG superfamily)
MSFRKAAFLMGVCVIFGGCLQGHHVMKTVGKGIVIASVEDYKKLNSGEAPEELKEHFTDSRLPDLGILVALVSAGIRASLRNLPCRRLR